MPADFTALDDPALWSALSDPARRELLALALAAELGEVPGLKGARIEVGPVERPYDYTAVAESDVGDLRTPLWSHARATIFCDSSVHVANRLRLAPRAEVQAAGARLRARLGVPCTLETRGLTLKLEPEPGVERTWTAERSRFRSRTAVTREDVVTQRSEEVDVRDLLAHFYTGPSLRVVGEDGSAFLLPASADAEGRMVTLCVACGTWSEGPGESCEACGGPSEVVVAVRPPRRTG
jgi:hypothetical protein